MFTVAVAVTVQCTRFLDTVEHPDGKGMARLVQGTGCKGMSEYPVVQPLQTMLLPVTAW